MKKSNFKAVVMAMFFVVTSTGLFAMNFDQNVQAAMSDVTYQEKTEVSMADVPESVSEAFQSSTYAMWQVSKIYKVTPQGEDEHYEFELTNDDGEAKTVKFNSDGEEVRS